MPPITAPAINPPASPGPNPPRASAGAVATTEVAASVAAAAPAGVGTLLKTVPADYTIDNAGAGTISVNGTNPNGCT